MRGEPLSVTRLLNGASEADQLRELLHEVLDPELGVDIVSLGLVYGLDVTDRNAAVLTTTTTPACPLGDYLSAEIERVLLGSGAVDQVSVQITHAPRWTPDMMDEAAKRTLGWR